MSFTKKHYEGMVKVCRKGKVDGWTEKRLLCLTSLSWVDKN